MYGAFVEQARRARGLSQRELARTSGIAQSNIAAIERGRREPGASTLHALLHACGFELVATAGPRTIACPPPSTDPLIDAVVAAPRGEAPVVTARTPMAVRARVLAGVLDAAEAQVRARG